MELLYLRHKEIDLKKWDTALQHCSNKLIYAESNYLNTMCKSWDAIIDPSYQFIMPIPIKKKWGIRYTPVVPFVQQLGIFSSLPVTPDIFMAFHQLFTSKIKFADYAWNYGNPPLKGIKKTNLILNLQDTYGTLFENYKQDLKKDLKKKQTEITGITNNYDIEQSILFFKTCIGERIMHVKNSDYSNLIALSRILESSNSVISKAVLGKDCTFATALFFKDENRLYNIASAISKEGKKIKANHFLYDALISDFAGSKYILDFEGSDIDGIANFYMQFGSVREDYYAENINNLPKLIRLFK